MGTIRWGIIGFGEAGSAFAKHIGQRLRRPVFVTDLLVTRNPVPQYVQKRLDDIRPHIELDICHLVNQCDIVISVVTPRAARAVAEMASKARTNVVFVDFNSISPKEKTTLSRFFTPGLYVDGAILGSIASEGARSNLALAGSSAKRTATLFRSVGLKVSTVAPQVGAASALKMCRSIFMKGIECLLVETLLAAAEFEIANPVLRSIEQTVNSRGFRRMVDMLVKTHAVHCGRRADEMRSVKEMMQEMHVTPRMSEATQTFLKESFHSGLAEHFRDIPESREAVINYLRSNHRRTS